MRVAALDQLALVYHRDSAIIVVSDSKLLSDNGSPI
jgi:hypothetical protein